MNSQKKIEVNLSSLLGLKAELERKKREVDLAKSWSGANRVKPKVKIKTKPDESSKNSKLDIKKDVEIEEEDSNLLRKSRAVLEAKAKVYDSLTSGKILGESAVCTTMFLVDFDQKQEESFSHRREKENENADEEKAESSDENFEYDSDGEWVDFVDCLGRTKRCHKDDLEAMKRDDEKLKSKLFPEPDGSRKEKERPEQVKTSNMEEIKIPELCSEDMKKDMLRQKWEEQERILADKKDIHYQDVLFNEARSHGVGYYEFSTDETERFRQQEELKRTREETLMQQASSKSAAERKKKQAEERAKAAKRRKRERLGLPPEEEDAEEDQNFLRDDDVAEENVESSKKVEILQRESDPRKDSVVRPWDIGKEGESKVLSQKEWIEKKRSERPKEFAPPSESIPRKKRKFGRKESDSYSDISSTRPEETTKTRNAGACVPPPQSYGQSSFGRSSSVSTDVEKSIEEGLKFLRKQVEEKQSHTKTGIFDFM